MNKQNKHTKKHSKLTDRDNSMLVARWEEEWGEDKDSKKEDQIYGDGRKLDFRFEHRCCTIKLYTWNLYNFINNVTPIDLILNALKMAFENNSALEEKLDFCNFWKTGLY